MPDRRPCVGDVARRIYATYKREDPDGKPKFGFHRLSQCSGPWPGPDTFLNTHSTVTIVDTTSDRPRVTRLSTRQWRSHPAKPVPNDALTTLHNTRMYSERHTQRSLACLIGERVHFRLLLHAIGEDGNGWRCVSPNSNDIETEDTVRTLFQTTFAPVSRPRIPHALWASFSPPSNRMSPLDKLIDSLARTAWTGLQRAHPSWTLVAAELPALLPGRRFKTYTGPNAKLRYLCPIIDAVAVSRDTGRVAVIDYKIALGARPFVAPSHVAQLLVNAYCFMMMTGMQPDVCVLVYALRCGEVHLATLSLDAIRVDAETGLASVIDWVRALTGSTPAEASAALRRLLERESDDLRERVVRTRINGQGRSTPATDAKTMVEIGLLMSGHGPDTLRRLASDVLTRALGGDADLVTRIEARRGTLTHLERTFFLAQPRPMIEEEDAGYDTVSESSNEEEDEGYDTVSESSDEESFSEDESYGEGSSAELPADFGKKDPSGRINIPELTNKQILTLLGVKGAERKKYLPATSERKEERKRKRARPARGSFAL